MNDYLEKIHALLNEMEAANSTALPNIAKVVASSMMEGGVLHVFGSGHSSLLAQEMFYRAGGLAPVNAMLDINLTVFGTSRPTWVERLEGYAPSLFASYDVQPGEVLLIISNSGINPVPVDVAMEAKQRGLITMAMGSVGNYASAASRHSSGKLLFDICDYTLDTCVPVGDAIATVGETAMGAVSTVLGSALLNMLAIAVAGHIHAKGGNVPVFMSQNVPGGDQQNADLIQRYRGRIPLMKP